MGYICHSTYVSLSIWGGKNSARPFGIINVWMNFANATNWNSRHVFIHIHKTALVTHLRDPSLRRSIQFEMICHHYSDVKISAMASQITGVSIAYLTVCSGPNQIKYQSSASLAFMMGVHRWPMNSPHKGPVTWKMLPLDDVILIIGIQWVCKSLRVHIIHVNEIVNEIDLARRMFGANRLLIGPSKKNNI